MPDEDAPIEEGELEPAEDTEGDASVAVEEPEAPPAPPTFTPEDDAQDLGQRYQQFAQQHDDPRVARREYGKHVDQVQSALGRIHRGIDPTAEDLASLEALGYEMPEPVDETIEPLWGAPWAEPTTMEEFEKIASERPWDALKFCDDNPGKVNDATRQQVLNYWAEHDRAGAIAYETAKAKADAIEETRQLMAAEMEAFRAEFGDVRAKHNTDIAEALHNKESLMTTRARAEIPNFEEYADGVTELMKENIAQDPDYANKLFALSVDDQVRHISDLTFVAAGRAQFHAAAQAQAESEAATAAKQTAAGERGRGAAGAPGGESAQSAMKKKFTEDIRRAVENPA